jgi:hypothetical protein
MSWNSAIMVMAICFCQVDGNEVRAREKERADWFGDRVTVEEVLSILQDSEVSQELTISPEQLGKFQLLEGSLRKRIDDDRERNLATPLVGDDVVNRTEERRKETVRVREKEYRPRVLDQLSAKQRQRTVELLRQINPARALVEQPDVKTALKLDSKQEASVKDLITEIQGLKNKAMAVLPPGEVILRDSVAFDKTGDERVHQLLSAQQRTEWARLIGKPIDASALRARIHPLNSARILQSVKNSKKFKSNGK